MHNAYLYTVVPDGIEDPSDLIFAPKAEFVLGGTEFGTGAYYRYGQAPALMITFTSAFSNVFKTSFLFRSAIHLATV